MMSLKNNLQNKETQKLSFKKIIIGYEIINNDFGFFAEFKEIFYPLHGVKIVSTQENIDYTFQEVEYYLLENYTLAKFIKKYSLDYCSRILLQTYSLEKYTEHFTNRKILSFLNKETYLKTNKTSSI